MKANYKTNLVYPFDDPDFFESWNLWLQYRKEIGKPIKGNIGKQAQLKKIARLAAGNLEIAKAIIMQSIENGWRGLFEVKQSNQTNETDKELSEALDRYFAN